MIKKCREQDRQSVLEYLYTEAAYNIFIIGDIEHFGFDKDFQQIYIEEENNVIKAVLLRYNKNAVYYTDDPHFNPDFMAIVNDYELSYFNGKYDVMKHVEPYIPAFKAKRSYFCSTNKNQLKLEKPHHPLVKKLTDNLNDIERLFDLLHHISEFNYDEVEKENFVENKRKSLEMGSTYFIEEDGLIVSSVTVTAETTINGMVVAVATHSDYRQRGYATALMKQLMYEYLVEKNKDLCLFYDNPKAGHIYLSLGFEPIGKWSMFHKEK